MAEAPNVLAQGTVDTTDEVVYTVPASTSAIVSVVIVNNDATTVTGIIIRLNGAATSNIVAKVSSLATGEQMKSGPWALGTGDTVRIQSTTGDDLASYTVEGIEFT